ncbi:hypothetical protein OH77DRAFT_97767 [Trametes cingulata]|nr:hypothetical protein OH77DRAFT_97767 [Trametes cingulata]
MAEGRLVARERAEARGAGSRRGERGLARCSASPDRGRGACTLERRGEEVGARDEMPRGGGNIAASWSVGQELPDADTLLCIPFGGAIKESWPRRSRTHGRTRTPLSVPGRARGRHGAPTVIAGSHSVESRVEVGPTGGAEANGALGGQDRGCGCERCGCGWGRGRGRAGDSEDWTEVGRERTSDRNYRDGIRARGWDPARLGYSAGALCVCK